MYFIFLFAHEIKNDYICARLIIINNKFILIENYIS